MRRLVLPLLMLAIAPGGAVAAAAADGWAGWYGPRFQTLGAATGLPHATATAIVQGEDGQMWIGTRGGLARYDGQRVRVFRQRSGDAASLPDNYVRALLPLAHGSMLVGTNVGGVVRYDPLHDGFVRLPGAEEGRIGTRILNFAPDGQGGALIASDHGVFRYDARTQRVVAVSRGRELAGGAFAVHRDPDGTIFAGADTGLFVLRPGAARFAAVAAPAIGDVWALTRDRAGRLWIGTGSNGIVLRMRDGRFVRPAALAGNAPAIGHRTVRAFASGPGGVMWVGTDGMGVLRVDPGARLPVEPLRNIPADPGSLGGDTVRDVTIDRTGRLWAATEVGASHADPATPAMFAIGNATADPRRALADTNVRGVMVDSADRIWIGMANGLIDRIDRRTGQVSHLRLAGQHAGQDIKAFVELPDGTVLVGGRGVIAIRPDGGVRTRLDLPELDDLPVISLAVSGRLLLIGTYRGLFVWDGPARRMRRFTHVDGDAAAIANNEVINIVAAGDGRAWIATPAGISRFDPATGRFVTFRNRPGDPASLPQNYTGSIVTRGSLLWVGTYGGIARGTAAGDGWRFRAITEAQGLANDNVAALLADRGGRIWAASASGISVVDPAGRQVRALSGRDGLTADAFNQRVAAATQGGDLLFGGTGGLTVLRPDRLFARRPAMLHPPVVTAVEQDGHGMPLDPDARHGGIAIDGGRHTVRIAFALTDYAAPQEVRYSYRLDGFDPDWVRVPEGTPASATYTGLPGGSYALRLRAEVPGIYRHVVTTRIDVSVGKSWYEHWWVRLLALLAMVLAIVGVVQLRTLVLRRRTRTLEQLVAARTQELRAANAALAELAQTDPLTGLANRRMLLERLETERGRAARGGSFALVLIDVDHFKRVNDTYGHPIGDRVLAGIAVRIAGAVRTADCVARYGGEELAIVLPDTGLDEAWASADRLRMLVRATPFVIDGIAIPVTISGGVVAASSDVAIAALLAAADRALYRAKAGGRDRIERADG
ncbi:diguanylate cyclase [Sphingomonas sp. VNH70]|uniref:diguanylate cyclase n=1 Tax=Sphingomonas silueang TaxID=3156617 RepID=UPI0032B3D3E5